MLFGSRDRNRRYREIVGILVKYGLTFFINKVDLDLRITSRVDKNKIKLSEAERIRLAIEELGTTFIKFGQILSTRHELLSEDIIFQLEKLQDNVPTFSYDDVEKTIQKELGSSIDELFLNFEREPFAAASISQVHRAVLKSGEKVAIKVQRPGLEYKIKLDISILYDLVKIIDKYYYKLNETQDLKKIVRQFEAIMLKELDFYEEGRNNQRVSKNFNDFENISFPKIYWNYTTKCIITMEYIEGQSLKNIKEFSAGEREMIAYNLSNAILLQMLRDGIFHADPHPGNIIMRKDRDGSLKIVFLDLGMVGKVNEDRRKQFIKFMQGVITKDAKLLIQVLINMGSIKDYSILNQLELDIYKIFDHVLDVPISEIKIEPFFNEIFEIVANYRIQLPDEVFLISKTLITLEGTVEKLKSSLNVIEITKDNVKKLYLRAMSPENILKELVVNTREFYLLAKNIPSLVTNFFRKLEQENFVFHVELQDFAKMLNRFDKVANRLVFSVIVLGMCVIIAGIIIGSALAADFNSYVTFLGIPLLEIGVIMGFLMFLFLIYSIFKSGSL